MTSSASPRLLAITGGHPVDLAAFADMLDAVCANIGWSWEHEQQPAAQRWLRPEHHGTWSAVLCHDIAGLTLRRGSMPTMHGPDHDTRAALIALWQLGQPMVITHHALAGWPAWDGWATAVGGRYLYAPGTLRDNDLASSGYRMAQHRAKVVAPDHPICAGISDFDLDDELYLCPIFGDEVVPLLETTADMNGALFHSTIDVMLGGDPIGTCGDHPPASRLIAWAKTAEASPLVYLQPGHGPETHGHPMYRRLLANSIRWASSPAANEWARQHPSPISVT
jgi:uncharacterized protein